MNDILVVENHRDNPERQHNYHEFQIGFEHGCHNATDFPDQLNRFVPLKRPVSSYVYGFHSGRRYVKRSATTTTPMQYNRDVAAGFRRWEKMQREG